MHNARVWLTVPTFNEAGNVERIVRAALAQLERCVPGEHRVLIVDDASPDGTGRVADALAAQLPAVEVLHRTGKQGLGRAYLAGFERALDGGAELVIVMDADYSHDPAHLPEILAAAAEHDLVLGSRYVPGGAILEWPRLRRALSRAGSLYARAILGVGVRDLTGGFRAIRREVLEGVELTTLRSQGYVFNIELSFRALREGFRVVEVPIVFRDRTVGESKISLSIAIEALWLVPSLRWPRLRRAWPARNVPLAASSEEPGAGGPGSADGTARAADVTATPAEAIARAVR
ncbi:MAG: polyprenol monophosphomannose synthase [Solirubrobacteraceae bacterium]